MTRYDYRKSVIEHLEDVERAIAIAKGLKVQGDKDINLRAQKEHRDYGISGATTEPTVDENGVEGSPRYTQDQFNALTEEDQRQKIDEGFNWKQGRRMALAKRGIREHLEEIVGSEGKVDTKLTGIIDQKDVLANIDANDTELVQKYTQYKSSKDLEKSIQDNKPIDPKVEDQLKKLESAARAQKGYDNVMAAGLGEQLAQSAAKLAQLSNGEGLSREDLLKGAKRIKKESERKLIEFAGRDYEEKAVVVVYKALRKMVTSGDPEDEDKAAQLYFAAQKGYGLGERSFKDIFPERSR